MSAVKSDTWKLNKQVLSQAIFSNSLGSQSISSPMYTTGKSTIPMPAYPDSTRNRLSEELDKPLHQFTTDELLDLCSELQDMGWARKEAYVQEILEKFLMHYRGEHPMAFQKNLSQCSITTSVPLHAPVMNGGAMSPGLTQTYKQIVVKVPYDIPEEFVAAFAERMIRDQLES